MGQCTACSCLNKLVIWVKGAVTLHSILYGLGHSPRWHFTQHTLTDHYHWLKITLLFRIKADSPFQSFVSVVLYRCYCIWYFCNMEMSIIYRDQQILIHFTRQTAVPRTRHFSARESVPTPLQKLHCTSLWPLYNIETHKILSFLWAYKIWFTVWQFWRCLT